MFNFIYEPARLLRSIALKLRLAKQEEGQVPVGHPEGAVKGVSPFMQKLEEGKQNKLSITYTDSTEDQSKV